MTDSLFSPPLNPTPELTTADARKQLRREMRHKRRSLMPSEANRAGRHLLKQFRRCPEYLRASRVALYLKNDGEIDTRFMLQDLWQRKREVLLPVLHPLRPGHLVFIRYDARTKMTSNRFGIAEPDFRYGVKVSARFISLICLPLVAFDARGNRLGMGGGFYDRTLAFKQGLQSTRPALAGCAYGFQEVTRLPVESWDIPLRMIVTDREVIR